MKLFAEATYKVKIQIGTQSNQLLTLDYLFDTKTNLSTVSKAFL